VRVALLVGPCPANECGVGDYTAGLAAALNAISVETHLIASGNWKMVAVLDTKKRLQNQNFDLIHIQYPSAGFGAKLGPQALALLRSCVVTIHEASHTQILRKVALFPFTIRPKHIVFTSDFERQFALSYAPWISQRSSVIPIPSNIRASGQNGPRSLSEVVHFGLIMPGKGLEDVLKLAELIHATRAALRIRIIGKPPSRYFHYFEELRASASSLPITWENNLTAEDVSKRLASSAIAYLPFPDGASERRATLKAALANGVAVITTTGRHTPNGLEGSVKFCRNPADALAAVHSLIERPDERAALVKKGYQYVRPHTWERVAEQHAIVYETLCRSKTGPLQDQAAPPEKLIADSMRVGMPE
jgi:glycosyltransferase involved in cell wall biosynthesis